MLKRPGLDGRDAKNARLQVTSPEGASGIQTAHLKVEI